jgi:hypothetical protein
MLFYNKDKKTSVKNITEPVSKNVVGISWLKMLEWLND